MGIEKRRESRDCLTGMAQDQEALKSRDYWSDYRKERERRHHIYRPWFERCLWVISYQLVKMVFLWMQHRLCSCVLQQHCSKCVSSIFIVASICVLQDIVIVRSWNMNIVSMSNEYSIYLVVLVWIFQQRVANFRQCIFLFLSVDCIICT